jgi:hypothetical protein
MRIAGCPAMDGFNDLAEDAKPILRAGMQQIVRSPRRTLRKEVRPFIFMGIIPQSKNPLDLQDDYV